MSLTLSQGMELFKEALFTLIGSNENEGNAEIFLTDLLVDQDEGIVKQVNTSSRSVNKSHVCSLREFLK